MKKIMILVAVIAMIVGVAVVRANPVQDAASTNAGWHFINGATTNGPVLTVTQSKVNVTNVFAGVTNVYAVVTNVAVSIKFEPFTGPSYVYP